MTAKTFTVINNGNVSLTVTGISFNTPAGIRHRADLSNFGGSSNFTGANFSGSSVLGAGASKTFTVDHEYESGPSDVRNGSIVIITDLGPSATIVTTTSIGTATPGGPVSVISPLPSQGTHTANSTNFSNGRASVIIALGSDGTFVIDCIEGSDVNSGWLSTYPSVSGSNYWVRFTRNSLTGFGNYQASESTGWNLLDQVRTVGINATGLGNGTISNATAVYLVEISNDGGTTIVSSGTYTLVASGTLGGIVNPLVDVTAISRNLQIAGIRFYPNGTREKIENQGTEFNQVSEFVSPWYLNGSSIVGNSYYIRATSVGRDLPTSGSLNTWIQLNQIVEWNVFGQNFGELRSNLFFEISTSPSASNIVTSGYVNLFSLTNIVLEDDPTNVPNNGINLGVPVQPERIDAGAPLDGDLPQLDDNIN